MSKYRMRAKADTAQTPIVNALRGIPGVSVRLKVDDIFVGYKGENYWFEIKSDSSVHQTGVNKGRVKKNRIEEDQIFLLRTWSGHYCIILWGIDEVLAEMGIK